MPKSYMPHELRPLMFEVVQAVWALGLEHRIQFDDYEDLLLCGQVITGVEVRLSEGRALFTLDCDYPTDRLKLSIECSARPKPVDEALFRTLSFELADRAAVSLGW